MIHSGFTCDLCGTPDYGYENEIAARRAEIAHIESANCPADLDGQAHLELQIKRRKLAELEADR